MDNGANVRAYFRPSKLVRDKSAVELKFLA